MVYLDYIIILKHPVYIENNHVFFKKKDRMYSIDCKVSCEFGLLALRIPSFSFLMNIKKQKSSTNRTG